MGTWNEDALQALRSVPGADPAASQNAAALQAIKDATATLVNRTPALAGTATTTAQTLAATTSKQVLAANPSRAGAVFQNDTGQVVLLAFGGTASASAYAVRVVSGGYYELPYRYTGAVSAFSTAASAAPHLLVTEVA